MYFLGIDLGSSSVKLAVVDGDSGLTVASAQYPKTEMSIASSGPGWAEQNPNDWWQAVVNGCKQMFADYRGISQDIRAIGISYQMHGLVLVDQAHKVLRPAIIWCDSRAVSIGDASFDALGADYCFEHLLNAPGNFTASKLRWVQQHEPEVFAKVHKAMLPGDYLVMRLTGQINTTASGLSEGTLWDFKTRDLAHEVLQLSDIASDIIPARVPSFGEQGILSRDAANQLGLAGEVTVAYRGGDQPNNAFSLNVSEPGQVAATAGTSGVIYGVSDKAIADRQSRVNTFLHVSDTEIAPRNGVLVCVSGAGRLYSWLRQILSEGGHSADYQKLNDLASAAPIGSEGLCVHPFGNGAERIYSNANLGAHMRDLDFNRHRLGHIVRAAQEGIVFALYQGFAVLEELGCGADVVRVAKGNMFLSEVFVSAFVNTTNTRVEFFDTDGAEGAARAAAIGTGFYRDSREAFSFLQLSEAVEPEASLVERYHKAYQHWQDRLHG